MRMKKKSRWKRLMFWLIGIFLLIGISGVYAINYSVNKVIESMAESLLETNIPLETASPSNIEIVEPEPIENGGHIAPHKDKAEDLNLNNQLDKESIETTTESDPSEDLNNNQVEKDKSIAKELEISVDEANDIKENVTLSEKSKVASILMGNLEVSDIKIFQELVRGGMTDAEKLEARKVLLEKLTPEEYNILSKMAEKYGVSQGKTYDQIQKEEANSSK